jgi:hypothetical protein
VYSAVVAATMAIPQSRSTETAHFVVVHGNTKLKAFVIRPPTNEGLWTKATATSFCKNISLHMLVAKVVSSQLKKALIASML